MVTKTWEIRLTAATVHLLQQQPDHRRVMDGYLYEYVGAPQTKSLSPEGGGTDLTAKLSAQLESSTSSE